MKLLSVLLIFGFLYFSILPQINAIFAADATASAIVKYDLAYPGMIPDHPAYKLKVLRDKLTERFISDPEKKISFYLLQADKGILATAMLVDKKNFSLAKETVLKAENNFTLINFLLKDSDKKLNSQTFNKLKTASLKHQEVLRSLIKRVPSADQETFKTALYFSETNLKSLKDLQNKKRKAKTF